MKTKHDLNKEDFFNFDTETHQRAKLPREAYLYFPNEAEVINYDYANPKKTQRKIFENVEFNPYEKEKLNEFYKYIETDSRYLEELKTINPSEILRFLQATEFDCAKTCKSIKNNFDWRKSKIPIQPNNNIVSILNSGFIYVHGRDNRFRPIIVVEPAKFNSKLFSYNDWLSSVIFLIEYVINYMMLPGQVENWNVLCNFEGVSLYSIPGELKSLMAVVQENYKCRLHQMYMINLGSWAKVFLGMLKILLGDSIEKKLKVVPSLSPENVLFHSIDKSQVKKVYFGSEEEKECTNFAYFFPPCMPHFITKDISLVSEEEYNKKTLYFNYKRSPFISQRLSLNIQGNLVIEGEEFFTARENITEEHNYKPVCNNNNNANISPESATNEKAHLVEQHGSAELVDLTSPQTKYSKELRIQFDSPISYIEIEKRSICTSCSCNNFCVIF